MKKILFALLLLFITKPIYAGGSVYFNAAFVAHISSIGHPSVFSFVQNTFVFTIDAWMKTNNTATRQTIVANTGTTYEKGFYLLYETYGSGLGTQTFRFGVMKAAPGVAAIDCHAPDYTIQDTGWHHVLVRGRGAGDNIDFFVDGVQRTTTYATSYTGSSSGNSSNSLAIAILGPISKTLQFNGNIANVRIWDRALTNTEVANAYHCYDVIPDGLQGHWSLTDTYIATDISNYKRTGTFTNRPQETQDGPPLNYCGGMN